MFILAPDEHRLVVKADINATRIRSGLQSDNIGKRIEISTAYRAIKTAFNNSVTAENTGIY